MAAAIIGSRPFSCSSAVAAQGQQLHRYWSGLPWRTPLPQELSILRLTAGRREEALCFVDLGHRRTRVTVVCGDRLQVTKRITLGGRHLDRVVADELGGDAVIPEVFLSSQVNCQSVRQKRSHAHGGTA